MTQINADLIQSMLIRVIRVGFLSKSLGEDDGDEGVDVADVDGAVTVDVTHHQRQYT